MNSCDVIRVVSIFQQFKTLLLSMSEGDYCRKYGASDNRCLFSSNHHVRMSVIELTLFCRERFPYQGEGGALCCSPM